jgi:hypothetical protein
MKWYVGARLIAREVSDAARSPLAATQELPDAAPELLPLSLLSAGEVVKEWFSITTAQQLTVCYGYKTKNHNTPAHQDIIMWAVDR